MPTNSLWRYVSLTMVRGAILAVATTLLAGLLAVLYSVPALAPAIQAIGLDLTSLRPLHTAFATAWLVLAGLAVVFAYLEDQSPLPSSADRLRLKVMLVCFAIAGAGILITVPAGVVSGREYIGFHPVLSAVIALGWVCFGWTWFRAVARGFWLRPVFVMMWSVGCLFFLYTFAEQHAYLLPSVFADPLVDKRIQWKATGTLVGAFNLFIYGSAIYIGGKLTGDANPGQNRKAWALFGAGLFNSFLNYGHHMYHLPQSVVLHWIAFLVSMTESVLFFFTLSDILNRYRATRPVGFDGALAGLHYARLWTAVIIVQGVFISIPPLNTLIHGTYVIPAHAMAAMLGLDSMIALAALIYLLRDHMKVPGNFSGRWIRWGMPALSGSIAALFVSLTVMGVVDGVSRYLTPEGVLYTRPEWLQTSGPVGFALSGIAVLISMSCVLVPLGMAAAQRFQPPSELDRSSGNGDCSGGRSGAHVEPGEDVLDVRANR